MRVSAARLAAVWFIYLPASGCDALQAEARVVWALVHFEIFGSAAYITRLLV